MKHRWFIRLFSTSFPTTFASVKKRMPPKKAPIQEKKVLLGRPSNNLKIGIVGQSHPFFFLLSSNILPTTIPQVFQMLESPPSSTLYPRQVGPFCSAAIVPHLALSDLGKSANFPYATIDPEASLLFASSLRSITNDYTIGSSGTRPRSTVRLVMRALQTRLPRPCPLDMYRYCRPHRCEQSHCSKSPQQATSHRLGRLNWCWARKRVPLSRTGRRWHLSSRSRL
jgi:hypothetical protein